MDHITQAKLFAQRRRFSRSDVRIQAQIRISGGTRHKVQVVDLSRAGFQMECLVYLSKDRPIFLTLPGFAPITCNIAWSSDWHHGCVFEYELHEAIFSHIVATQPGISQGGA